MKRKEKVLESVKITGIADKGMSVGRASDGQVVFVEDCVPGDVVDVLVIKKKKGFFHGVPRQFIYLSDARVEPFCSHFGLCGGCKWQHFDYAEQLNHKFLTVENAVRRIGKNDTAEILPIVGANPTQLYRNKLEFSFSAKRWLTNDEIATGAPINKEEGAFGFHAPGSFDKVVEIRHCYLQPEPSNAIRNSIRVFAAQHKGYDYYDAKKHTGYLRNVIVRTNRKGEAMVTFSFNYEHEEKRTKILNHLLENFPQITTLCYVINGKHNDTILDLDIVTYHGSGYLLETLGDVTFKIGPKSFFQTNTIQAEKLYTIAADFAELNGSENVYDLYTGIGSIALFVSKRCKSVVGIEEVAAAIDDANLNTTLNQITNATFYAGDVKDILKDNFKEKHGAPDLVITDPPRAGMHPEAIELLLELNPPKIVYISCNPATQARDFLLMSEKYDVVKVQPVDMFPHTHHIETVALMIRKTQ